MLCVGVMSLGCGVHHTNQFEGFGGFVVALHWMEALYAHIHTPDQFFLSSCSWIDQNNVWSFACIRTTLTELTASTCSTSHCLAHVLGLELCCGEAAMVPSLWFDVSVSMYTCDHC